MRVKRRAPGPKFVCTGCMRATPRWPGATCRGCGAFATSIVTLDEARGRGLALPMSLLGDARAVKATRLRWRTGLAGFDRILSHEGGLVPSASVLIAAVPGSGKTTLLLAAAGEVARGPGRRAVYASAEQDVSSLRALGEKLGVAARDRLLPVSVRSLGDVEMVVDRTKPALLVIDSANELARHMRVQPSAVVGALHELAHARQVATIITSHVNSDGLVRGGPEVAHATDAVLLLSGEPKKSTRRELGADKNRHGDTTLRATIEMTPHGFVDMVDTPPVPRRALGIGAALALLQVDGAPHVVEVQVMLTTSTGDAARRITAAGISVARIQMLLAVVERQGLPVAGDVTLRCFGAAVTDAGALDAAAVAAIISASRRQALPAAICFAGEVGLDGVVRGVDVGQAARGLGLLLVGQPGERLVDAVTRRHHLNAST